MEDTYYFSQGRLISTTPYNLYNKFKDEDKKDDANNKINNLLYKFMNMNFKIYNKSILRY
jgi:hypothetical protein